MTKEQVKYCEFLEDQRVKNPLKVPRYLSAMVHELPKKQMKAVALYLELKPFFYDGRLKEFKKRRKCWALTVRMSLAAFNYKIKELQKMKLAGFDPSGNLVLCSWDHFYQALNLNGAFSKKKRFYRVENIYNGQVEYLFKYFAVKENFEQQTRAIEKKVYKKEFVQGEQMRLMRELMELRKNEAIAIEERQRRGEILSKQIDSLQSYQISDSNPDFKKFRKNQKFAAIYAEAEEIYWRQMHNFLHQGFINFDVSLTCKAMARLFGCSSASSGHYWQQLLNFWIIEPRCVHVHDFDEKVYKGAKYSGNMVGTYFEGAHKKGVFKDKTRLFRRLPNKIHLQEL